MSRPLDGRRILITGAATGIGAAAVRVLGAAGAGIAATYHVTPPPDSETGVAQAVWLQCDACDEESVTATFRQAADALGGLDVLVHAAGLWHPGIPGQITAGDLRHVLDTNFTSTVFTNQAAFELMRRHGGRIINFGSSEAAMGSPMSASYAAAKGAVHAWTRSAAKAWAAQGITVNAVAPAVETPGADRLRDFLGPDVSALIDQQLKLTIPVGGKLGDPETDLSPLLVFLAGEGSRFITGQLLAADGGLMMVGS